MHRRNENLFPGALEAKKRFPSHELVVWKTTIRPFVGELRAGVPEGQARAKRSNTTGACSLWVCLFSAVSG